MNEIITSLLKEGGGWALAALTILGIIHMAKAWVADIKEGAEREREARRSLEELHRATLDHITSSAAGLAEVKASIAALGNAFMSLLPRSRRGPGEKGGL